MIKFLKQKYYLLPFLILFLIPATYSLSRAGNQNYWDGAIGNWLATMLGVIGGIPIALEVNRFITEIDDQKKRKVEKDKEKAILLLVKEELDFNLSRLNDRKGNISSLPLHPFKTDLWDALSDSGEIKFINSSSLLNRITSAYHIIKIVKKTEEQCYIAMRSATVSFGNKTGHQLLLEDARGFDNQNDANTKYAIDEISKYLVGN